MPSKSRRPLYSDGDSPPPPSSAAAAAAAAAAEQQQLDAATSASGALDDAGADNAAAAEFEQPCSIKALSGGVAAGALGYAFGFLPSAVRNRGRMWGAVHGDGVRSAQQLALMSGLYTLVHCILGRLRQTEDGWNRGAAGCATGVVLGWGGGPWGALQSCAGIGGISYILDLGSGAPAAAAAVLGAAAASQDPRRRRRRHAEGGGDAAAPPAVAVLALPPLMWLGSACCGGYFEGGNGGGGGGGRRRGGGGALRLPWQQQHSQQPQQHSQPVEACALAMAVGGPRGVRR